MTRAAFLCLATLLSSTTAAAQSEPAAAAVPATQASAGPEEAGATGAASPPESAPAAAPSPFDRPVAFGAYTLGWAGAYAAVGIGGRGRWEMFPELGVEVFGEALLVEHTGGLRHDQVVGFDLFVPLRVEPWLRLRPLFGFCAVFSMVEPQEAHAPRADDILFGVHGGGGVEIVLASWLSIFADLQAGVWLGHDRAAQGWTGAFSDSYVPFGFGQLAIGAQVHL